MCIISKPDYTAIHIIECAHNIYMYSNIYRRYACTSVLGIPITYYTLIRRGPSANALNIYYIFYVLRVCVCVQNDAPYGRNETESRTGLFTSMECSSARSLVVERGIASRFVNIMHRDVDRTPPRV